MNKRLKKKKCFKKAIYYVKISTHKDIDKCPTFKCYSWKKVHEVLEFSFKILDCDVFIKREYPFIRFASQYEREKYR